MSKLSLDQIEINLSKISGWRLKEQKWIEREIAFADFKKAMQFVHQVADLAEKANHHPDILIQYNKVKLSLTTHDFDGLTGKDFSLAQKINKLVLPK